MATLTFDKVNNIITVDSPFVEITIQELHNKIVDFEDELINLSEERIVSSAGKEDLGGGVSVGITLTLLNDWQLAFEARGGPTYTQCRVSGGNLVADNIAGSIYPTAFTQILITASASATLQDLDAIQYGSYGNGVSLDPLSSNTGTSYPVGNQEFPVNNLADAVAIAVLKGFHTLFIRHSMTLSTENIDEFTIIGNSHVNTILNLDPSLSCIDVTIKNANVIGTLDGGTHLEGCTVGTINYVNGHIHDSGLYGTITLGGGGDAVIANSRVVDPDMLPIVDMGGTGQSLSLPNWSGPITISNLTDATQIVAVGLDAGVVILDATISAGFVTVGGVGNVTDNTTGTAIVDDNCLLCRSLITSDVRAQVDQSLVDYNVDTKTNIKPSISI